jgi:hypothetical protein
MSSKNTAVFGLYVTPATAEAAVDHLLAKGFTDGAISVLLPDDESTRAFAHEKHTKAPEGTATGVTAGGVIGGSLGLLAGIGALAIPGVGPLIAAGPIMASLAGFGIGGAVGGLVGALVGMGIPEYEAKRYEGAVKDGGTLLSVHCDTSDQIDAAKTALRETGATDISSTSEAGSKDTTGGRNTFGDISEGDPITRPGADSEPVASHLTTDLPVTDHAPGDKGVVDDSDLVRDNHTTTSTKY